MKKLVFILAMVLVLVAFVNPLHLVGDPDCWTQVDEQEYCSCTLNEEEEEDPAPLVGEVTVKPIKLESKINEIIKK